MALLEAALHQKRHAHTLTRRAHRRDVVMPRRRHQARPRPMYDFTEDSLLARIWKRKEEREQSAAAAEREMARIKAKPSFLRRAINLFTGRNP